MFPFIYTFNGLAKNITLVVVMNQVTKIQALIFFLSATTHPKNMGIFAKFVVHKCSLNIFFSICYADSENVMDISVSAWTLEIQAD